MTDDRQLCPCGSAIDCWTCRECADCHDDHDYEEDE
jgi:hypothetical protein